METLEYSGALFCCGPSPRPFFCLPEVKAMIQFLLHFRFFFLLSWNINFLYNLSAWPVNLNPPAPFHAVSPTSLYKRSSVSIYLVGSAALSGVSCPSGKGPRCVCGLSLCTMSLDRHGLFCRLPLSLRMELSPVLKWCWRSQKLLVVFSSGFRLFLWNNNKKQNQRSRPELRLSSALTRQQNSDKVQMSQEGALISQEFCDEVGDTCRNCRLPCPRTRCGGRVLPPEFNPNWCLTRMSAAPGSRYQSVGKPQACITVMTHLPTQNRAAS